ncbi:MAG: lantibiotic dehydratase [Alphaproteobacteria bacterium]|nr:lantibiotic dehydratase [Alphaproteobacteria bacterium]
MSKALFTPASFFMVRAPTWPFQMYERFLAQDNWLENLMAFYDSNEFLREAIYMASPSLYKSLSNLSLREYKDGKPVKNYEKLGISLWKYTLRMSTRATPFGLFAFVARGSWSNKMFFEIDLKEIHKRTRPDFEWLDSFIRNLYHDSQHFFRLPVYMNPLIQQRGDRIFLTYMRLVDDEVHKSNKTASIKSNKLIDLIFVYAKKPIVVKNLVKKIKEHLPNSDGEKISNLVEKLLLSQFLLPDLFPSLLSPTPFQDFIDSIPAEIGFQNIAYQIKLYDNTPVGRGETKLEKLYQEMKSKADTPFCIQSDSYYTGKELSLPYTVGKELGKAISFLWKLGVFYQHPLELDSYLRKFIEKYGFERTIPLLEMLSEEKGLGSVYKVAEPTSQKTSPLTQIWEQWLDNTWQESLLHKKKEIELTDSLVDNFLNITTEKAPDPYEALNSLDVFCKVWGPSPEDINQGNFMLQYCQSAWQGVSAFGRFLDILGPHIQDQARQLLQKEEQQELQTLFIEASYFPKSMRYANVSSYPCLRAYRLDLTEQKCTEGNLALEDIYVGATPDRFYLTLKEGGVEINACSGSMVNTSIAPEAFQFMYDVSQAKYQSLYNFSWGKKEKTANFLPRIRYRKTILSPAKWNLGGDHFRRKTLDKVKADFKTWADEWALPSRCFLGYQEDQNILIDRAYETHIEMLARKLIKGESLKFTELLENPSLKSSEGYHFTEIIVPFLKNSIYTKREASYIPRPHIPIPVEARWKFPGQEWLYLKLYVAHEVEDFFLLNRLSPFMEHIGQDLNEYQWFFVRYGDPEPHLRLRIKLDTQTAFSGVISIFEPMYSQWMKEGLIKNVVIASYEREVERYGGVNLIDAVEEFFCADTIATISWLKSIKGKTSYPEPVLHGLSIINFFQSFSLSIDEMLSVLMDDSTHKNQKIKRNSNYKNLLSFLLEKLNRNAEKDTPYEVEKTKYVSSLRLEAIKVFSEQSKRIGLSQISLYQIYRNLIHMHCNRLGCTLEMERETILYARDALLQLKWQNKIHKAQNVV